MFYSCNPILSEIEMESIRIEFVKQMSDSDGVTKITVLINYDLYPQIERSIETYLDDLIDENYIVELYTVLNGSPDELRSFLKERYDLGMDGCLLIGDLPIAWYKIDHHCPNHKDGEVFPCDLFYMDMDGTFTDVDDDGVYDLHSGNTSPEIWMGRLTASNLTYGNKSEAELINNYFLKNHNYRKGLKQVQNRALLYVELNHEDFLSGIKFAYNNIDYTDETQTTKDGYMGKLSNAYETVMLCAHGTPELQVFQDADGNETLVTVNEVLEKDPHAYFYINYGCSTGKYTVRNNYLNWHIFADSYGLTALGSAKNGSQLQYSDFYRPFGQGKTIGESFKDWYSVIAVDGFENWEMCCFYGMTLLGDPTLKKQEYLK